MGPAEKALKGTGNQRAGRHDAVEMYKPNEGSDRVHGEDKSYSGPICSSDKVFLVRVHA
jgi:hypothetical protein